MIWNPKRDILPLLVLLFCGGFTIYFNGQLPDLVPSHFNSQGMPDGYSSKTSLIAINAGMIVGMYLLLTFIPFIDPFWRRIEKKYNVLLMFRDIALVFLSFDYVITMRSAAAGHFQLKALGVGLGLLFMLLGNYLPKLPRNFFFGIRSPWTLASEIVWRKTHVVSGWLFVLAGAVVIALSLLNLDLEVVMFIAVLPVAIVSGIIYPLFLYKKLEREGKLSVPEL